MTFPPHPSNLSHFNAEKHINEISIDRHLRDESDCQKIIQLYVNVCVMNTFGEFAVGGSFGPIFRNALKSSIAVCSNKNG